MMKTQNNEKRSYPGYVSEQKKNEDRIKIKEAKNTKKTEKKNRQRYIRQHAKNVPFFQKECLADISANSWILFTGWVLLMYLCRGASTSVESSYDSVDPVFFKGLAGLTTLAYILMWLKQYINVRSEKIYTAAQRVENLKIKDDDRYLFYTQDIRTGELDKIYEAYRMAPEWGIERSLWQAEFATDSFYFDQLMTKKFTPASQANIHQAIIENHLKTHPEDIKRILDNFDKNTIPKKLLKKYARIH